MSGADTAAAPGRRRPRRGIESRPSGRPLRQLLRFEGLPAATGAPARDGEAPLLVLSRLIDSLLLGCLEIAGGQSFARAQLGSLLRACFPFLSASFVTAQVARGR